MKKITIRDIQKLKGGESPFATVTAYDYVSAQNADAVDIPLILVGDSAAMVVYGMENTIPISMDELLFLVRAVCRGTKKALVVADMPFMSYQVSVEEAVRNAGRLIQAGAGAVKLEGGLAIMDRVQALTRVGIPVMGHIGMTPQSVNQYGGYKVQGRGEHQSGALLEDAKALESAGAFSIVLEAMPTVLAKSITEAITIPTIGIGAGSDCDGQIMVLYDLLGLFDEFSPRFVKPYAHLKVDALQALRRFKEEVEFQKFPSDLESYQ